MAQSVWMLVMTLFMCCTLLLTLDMYAFCHFTNEYDDDGEGELVMMTSSLLASTIFVAIAR